MDPPPRQRLDRRRRSGTGHRRDEAHRTRSDRRRCHPPRGPAVQPAIAAGALRAFADDLADPTGDLVVAALMLAADRRGRGLTRVLEGLAVTVEAEVALRRQVDADRATPGRPPATSPSSPSSPPDYWS